MPGNFMPEARSDMGPMPPPGAGQGQRPPPPTPMPGMGGQRPPPAIDPGKWNEMNAIRKAMGLPEIENPEHRRDRLEMVQAIDAWSRDQDLNPPPGGDYGKGPDFNPMSMGIQGENVYQSSQFDSLPEWMKMPFTSAPGASMQIDKPFHLKNEITPFVAGT